MVAAAIGGSAVLSAGTSLLGGQQQQGDANAANAAESAQYQQERSDLMPYMNTGLGANQALQQATGTGLNANGSISGNPLTSSLLSPINMSENMLETTPGYQFNLQQGLKSVQNGAAAQGLGSSGAALKGAATYATGLADSTYQNQFANAVTNQTNQFNRLMGLTQLGQNSAANVGAAGIQTAQNQAANYQYAGNAAAGSEVGAANSLGGISSAYALNNLSGGSLFGGTSAVDSAAAQASNGGIGTAFGSVFDAGLGG